MERLRHARAGSFASTLFSLYGLVGLIVLAVVAGIHPVPIAGAAVPDREEIEKVLGPGQLEGDVLVVRLHRAGPPVTFEGEAVPDGLGLTSWAAWRRIGRETMVMGKLVLPENDVNPVISALEGARIEVTALHDFFPVDDPQLMLLYFYGVGKPDLLAQGVQAALAKTETIKLPAESAAAAEKAPEKGKEKAAPALDAKRIEKITGLRPQHDGGALKIRLGKQGVTILGYRVQPAMGLYSWASFVGTNDQAQVAGQIVATAPEVNSVIRVLRNNKIDLFAVDSHFLDEEPRVFFLHFRGSGPVERLALAMREVFDIIKAP